jgi:hypothetical protein
MQNLIMTTPFQNQSATNFLNTDYHTYQPAVHGGAPGIQELNLAVQGYVAAHAGG